MRIKTALANMVVGVGLILALPGVVSAQLTTMPIPLAQWFNNSGQVLSSGGLCVFRAGTSTLANTYTTAAGTVANANPILFDSAGRATTQGVFLTPGSSYKFLLKDFTNVVGSKTCVPDTGTTLWSVDNILATPPSSVNEDVTGIAGVSFTAGELAFLSDGTAGTNAGQWYQTRSDLSWAGVLPLIGFAVTNITAGESGSFRLGGQVTGLTGLSSGADYYVATSSGVMTSTAPTMVRWVGRAVNATTINVQPNPRSTPIKPHLPCGRLTLTSAVPVTTSDVTAATTLYYVPYGGCTTATVYDGVNKWYEMNLSQLQIAVPAVANQMYDAWLIDNGSAPNAALELTAWTNDTTRATALTTQDGVYVKTGAATRLYLGSFRTTAAAGQTEDSVTKRYVWNYYNRVPRTLLRTETTASWNYNTATWRQANNSTANQVDLVVGVQEVLLYLSLRVDVTDVTAPGSTSQAFAGIGEDSTTAFVVGMTGTFQAATNAVQSTLISPEISKYPAIGRHIYAWIERGDGSGNTVTWSGVVAGLFANGISGWMWG